MRKKRAILLYNSQAGRGKIEKRLAQIVEIFSDAGWRITPQPIIFGADPFEDNERIDMAVVAGGDGTLNYVVNQMMNDNLSIPIGVIPAGTANDFAGAIGMSNSVVKAARQIVNGNIELIDCGKVEQLERENGESLYFVNIFSFGIFTTTSQRTPEELKHRVGKLAYMLSGFKEVLNYHGIPLTITADSGTFYYPTLMGLVFNGETAGRVPIARKSNLRDGVFDCIFLRKRNALMSAFDMGLYLLGINTGAVKFLRTSQLKLVSPLSEDTDVDGQRGGDFPLKVTCLHAALKVVCPQ